MEFLGNSSAFLQTHIFLPDPFFLLFTRFNFRRAQVPSSRSAFLYQRVVPRQEPAVDAVLSKQSCIEFKRLTLGKPTLACSSHPLHIVGMNYPADHVRGTKLLKCQTCVFAGDTICVNRLAVPVQHDNYLGNKINELLKFLFRTLTLGDVDHSAHKFNEMAGRAQNRMTYDVDRNSEHGSILPTSN